jgi:hypothetical protein
MATSGDILLAIREDFYMATDTAAGLLWIVKSLPS